MKGLLIGGVMTVGLAVSFVGGMLCASVFCLKEEAPLLHEQLFALVSAQDEAVRETYFRGSPEEATGALKVFLFTLRANEESIRLNSFMGDRAYALLGFATSARLLKLYGEKFNQPDKKEVYLPIAVSFFSEYHRLKGVSLAQQVDASEQDVVKMLAEIDSIERRESPRTGNL